MREVPICPCPECWEGDIIQLDTSLYTCTSCGRSWSYDELYEALFIDQLQKLAERKLHISPSPSQELENVEFTINYMCIRIREQAKEIALLEKEMAVQDCSPYALSQNELQEKLELHKKHLSALQNKLEQMMERRDELSTEEDI